MKKYVVLVFLFASFVLAQDKNLNVKADSSAVQDTIRIRDLVQQQIQKALERQSNVKASVMPDVLPEKINVQAQTNMQPNQLNLLLLNLIDQPIHIQIFVVVSVMIMSFVAFRRLIHSIKQKSLNALKQKIALLRADKIESTTNPKLQLARKLLRGKEMVFMKSDSQISRTAKELNISKGELLLAARLKLFEVGKM